jgi:hypothetical protein
MEYTSEMTTQDLMTVFAEHIATDRAYRGSHSIEKGCATRAIDSAVGSVIAADVAAKDVDSVIVLIQNSGVVVCIPGTI